MLHFNFYRNAVILALCVFFSMPLSLGAQTAEEEKVAIRAVLDEAVAYYLSHSLAETVKKFWILDDATFLCVAEGDGKVLYLKKDDLLQFTLKEDHSKVKVEKTNLCIVVNGNMANVYVHQKIMISEEDITIYSHETRSLQKIDGVWKIHNANVVRYTPKG